MHSYQKQKETSKESFNSLFLLHNNSLLEYVFKQWEKYKYCYCINIFLKNQKVFHCILLNLSHPLLPRPSYHRS